MVQVSVPSCPKDRIRVSCARQMPEPTANHNVTIARSIRWLCFHRRPSEARSPLAGHAPQFVLKFSPSIRNLKAGLRYLDCRLGRLRRFRRAWKRETVERPPAARLYRPQLIREYPKPKAGHGEKRTECPRRALEPTTRTTLRRCPPFPGHTQHQSKDPPTPLCGCSQSHTRTPPEMRVWRPE